MNDIFSAQRNFLQRKSSFSAGEQQKVLISQWEVLKDGKKETVFIIAVRGISLIVWGPRKLFRYCP